jgi:uncharacterized protein (TIGR02147 family)
MQKDLRDIASVGEFLNCELVSRQSRNSSYSLRAFSRDLGISTSRLSEIISSNDGISMRSAQQIAERLKLRAPRKQYWLDLAAEVSSRSPVVRKTAAQRLSDFRKTDSLKRLEEDRFRLIADWYHSAIVELSALSDFQSDSQWMAERLGISKPKAEKALQRLLEAGLMEKDANGRWRAQMPSEFLRTRRPRRFDSFTGRSSSSRIIRRQKIRCTSEN